MSENWRPYAKPQQWRLRAQLLRTIRQFFAEHDVLEVETPLLCQATGTDPQLDFFVSQWQNGPQPKTLYLQTSPEFAMKRLIAAGSGSIYQICKAFRQGESGRFHNPEFTILEWYRLGFDLTMLMDEVSVLLHRLLPDLSIKKIEYRQLFQQYIQLDPLQFNRNSYRQTAEKLGFIDADRICADEHAIWLDFLFSHAIQPNLAKHQIDLVYGYPAVLSSLARLNENDPRISERVEVFINGIEVGNGYHELTDAKEQGRRFQREISYRKAQQLPAVTADLNLLAALQNGLPECSGIAIGLDRLLMIICNTSSIDEVLSFPVSRA